MENKCRICAKQYFCNRINNNKDNKVPASYAIFKTANEMSSFDCKQIKFSETKNLGEVKYGRNKSSVSM